MTLTSVLRRIFHRPLHRSPPPRLVSAQHERCFGSPALADQDLARFCSRADYAQRIVAEREPYLSAPDVDGEVFGTHWGREWLDTVAAKIGAGDREMLERLRLIYNFTGFPIVQYRRAKTFPTVDPVFARYLKLSEITPDRYRFAAPAIAGEAGWRFDSGLVNVDVAIVQERIQFLYFGGVLDWLENSARAGASVMEIGAGCGLFALAMQRVLRPARYFICDVPECLAISFAYLNLTLPDQHHYVALPDGTHLANTGEIVPFDSIQNGIIYIPNYMMHRHARQITVDMAVNAMSLHEMRSAQIAYYCQFMREATAPRNGVFVDINAHYKHENPTNDPLLRANFTHQHKLDFVDLALGARIWSNSEATLGEIIRRHDAFKKGFDLENAFRIDDPHEEPHFSTTDVFRILNEDLGDQLGVDLDAWMKQWDYQFANHLEGYRIRFPATAA
jgi:hypothetical protein